MLAFQLQSSFQDVKLETCSPSVYQTILPSDKKTFLWLLRRMTGLEESEDFGEDFRLASPTSFELVGVLDAPVPDGHGALSRHGVVVVRHSVRKDRVT